MDIQISYDYRKEDLEKLPLEELTRFVLAREDKPFNTEVSISFVTDEAIAELNEKYRGKTGPTDVLSFECDGVDDDLSAMTLAEDPIFELGDVVIAPDVASRQTREFGTTFLPVKSQNAISSSPSRMLRTPLRPEMPFGRDVYKRQT